MTDSTQPLLSPRVAFVGQSAYFGPHLPQLPNYTFHEYIHKVTPLPDLERSHYDLIYFFRGEHIPRRTLEQLTARSVCLSTEPMPRRISTTGRIETSPDRQTRFADLGLARGKFDRLYHFDPTSVSYLEAASLPVTGVFRLPVNLTTYFPHWARPKPWAAFFFGRDSDHRRALLDPLKHALGADLCHATHGFLGSEFVRLAQRARVGINLHVDALPSTEPRLYLYAACGCLIISEPLSDNAILRAGEHYIELTDPRDLIDLCRYYADPKRDRERERIARAAYAQIKKHLSANEVWPALTQEILNGVKANAAQLSPATGLSPAPSPSPVVLTSRSQLSI